VNYQISDLERITGIKAHTIRIWEKRYSLIKPHRTETNIRFYDDEQAVKLLNIVTLLDNGFKISMAASFNDIELREKIAELGKLDLVIEDSNTRYLNALIGATLLYNEVEFSKLYVKVIKEFGIYDGMTKVIYPFLNRLGLMWLTNETFPAQEHFASNLIRRKLIAAIDNLPIPVKSKNKFILFLPPNEWHDIGLLFSELLIRSKGNETIYLGQNVPIENLELVIQEYKPTHILTFFIAKHTDKVVEEVIKNNQLTSKKCMLLIGGLAQIETNKNKKIKYLRKPSDLYEYV